jgi:putative addiction module component (TIGR02574 family)
MSDAEELLAKALLLPEHERAELAARLLKSLRATSEGDVDAAWAAEIERRCAAVDAGLAITSDWEDVRRRIESDIFGR